VEKRKSSCLHLEWLGIETQFLGRPAISQDHAVCLILSFLHLLTFRCLSVCDVKQHMSAVRSRDSSFVCLSVITIGSRVLSNKLTVGQKLKNSIQPVNVHEASLLSSQDHAMVFVLSQMKPVHTLLPEATHLYNRRNTNLYSNNALIFYNSLDLSLYVTFPSIRRPPSRNPLVHACSSEYSIRAENTYTTALFYAICA
jgi:hypothetical protein